jgi:hypothetical protein
VLRIALKQDSFTSYMKPYFISSERFLQDSNIASSEADRLFLLGLIGERNIQSELLYRGSRDAFRALEFHEKCDQKGPSITLFKSDRDKRFGGYTSMCWDSTGNDKADQKAFLFSLDLYKYYPIKKDHSAAIFCNSTYGPTFGGGYDLSAFQEPFNEKYNCRAHSIKDKFNIP